MNYHQATQVLGHRWRQEMEEEEKEKYVEMAKNGQGTQNVQ